MGNNTVTWRSVIGMNGLASLSLGVFLLLGFCPSGLEGSSILTSGRALIAFEERLGALSPNEPVPHLHCSGGCM